MMEEKFKTGDVVKLAIEGPRMVVTGMEEDGRVKCFWYNKHHQPHTESFLPELLVSAPEGNRSAGFYAV